METSRAGSRTEVERGAVLIVVPFMVIAVGSLVFALFFEAMAERTSVIHQETSQLALDVAETGLVRAELEIRGMVDPDGDGVGNVSGTFGGGVYSVTATQHGSTDERWTLVAVGTHALSTRRIEVGLRRRSRQRYVEGLYSRETLDFGGLSQTDAYDSRLGTYADQAVNVDDSGTYAGKGGHIGSGQDIVLHGSSTTIRGNAVPGQLYQVEANGTPVVWGDTLPRRRTIDLPVVPYSEFETACSVNNNDSLLGTNALGVEETQDADDLSHPGLRGLSKTEVAAMATFDTLLADDETLNPMTYGELVAEDYPTKLEVSPTTLQIPTGSVILMYSSLSEVLVLDREIALSQPASGDDYYQDDDDAYLAGATYPGGQTTPAKPGRISYDPETRALRATAGAAVVLDGGTYFFSDIKLVGRAYLCVRGPSTIYVTGDFDLSGGSIVNESGVPGDLRVIVHPYALPPGHVPESCSVKLRGGSEIAAAFYAPEADVTIGGGDELYGSVVARKIRVLGNVRFHYDTALGESGSGGGATIERLYWRDLSVPQR